MGLWACGTCRSCLQIRGTYTYTGIFKFSGYHTFAPDAFNGYDAKCSSLGKGLLHNAWITTYTESLISWRLYVNLSRTLASSLLILGLTLSNHRKQEHFVPYRQTVV